MLGCLIHESVFITLANGSARSSFTRCIGGNDYGSKAQVLIFSSVAINYGVDLIIKQKVFEGDLSRREVLNLRTFAMFYN